MRAVSPFCAWDNVLLRGQALSMLATSAKQIFGGPNNPSFWVGADQEARTPLDHIAKDILKFHTARLQLTGRPAGAEYWVQFRSPSQPFAERGMDWHFDKDEDLLDEQDITVAPAVSTVTYLSSAGWPLLVLSEPSLATGAEQRGMLALAPLSGQSVSIFAVFPKPGRHVAFSGDLFHGCPLELGSCKGERWSLVVNLWFGHRPLGMRRSNSRKGGQQREIVQQDSNHIFNGDTLLTPDLEVIPDRVPASGSRLNVGFGHWSIGGLRLPREVSGSTSGCDADGIWEVFHEPGSVHVSMQAPERLQRRRMTSRRNPGPRTHVQLKG